MFKRADIGVIVQLPHAVCRFPAESCHGTVLEPRPRHRIFENASPSGLKLSYSVYISVSGYILLALMNPDGQPHPLTSHAFCGPSSVTVQQPSSAIVNPVGLGAPVMFRLLLHELASITASEHQLNRQVSNPTTFLFSLARTA